ncbi:NAD-dependent protein deacetylase Sirt6 [Penaeus vannamei]|uniref:protein acetyllysine N-acetyltransferase n=1 Tax=Penaeus vannamei TaxID=6689 RepID=A0A3R7Q068_PENVA|nr:NAD-dependent protein deacetylase Sirt6-like isoform X1 [Penaeus vannamei]AZI71012.1 sirtuin 6 [Penaeus vannamei]ROT65169.1 hypothetical protein C7M84_016890 [Penaeus vannamei]WPC83210.1 SIRT6 [Penaeus vannamei]
MSCNYAEGLSKYENKGKLGLPERFDAPEDVERKVQILAEMMKESKHTVFHTGAGISTSAGIPDFRGPKGVWTLEKQGLKPDINISWDDARPTLTHMAILSLERQGYVQYVITQNIDGLHLRSGLPRQKLSELHGNMFVDICNYCNRQFVRSTAVTTVGQKSEGLTCPGKRGNGRKCRGKLHDTILDWEDGLPAADLDLAIAHSCAADLSICLGTTLQIVPSGNLPVDTKKRGGKLVICNLQPTKQDRYADLIINTYVDNVMKRLLELMDIKLLDYNADDDPMKITQGMLIEHRKLSENSSALGLQTDDFEPIEWTIPEEWVKDKVLEEKVKSKKVIRNKRTTKPGDVSVNDVKKRKTSLDGEVHVVSHSTSESVKEECKEDSKDVRIKIDIKEKEVGKEEVDESRTKADPENGNRIVEKLDMKYEANEIDDKCKVERDDRELHSNGEFLLRPESDCEVKSERNEEDAESVVNATVVGGRVTDVVEVKEEMKGPNLGISGNEDKLGDGNCCF